MKPKHKAYSKITNDYRTAGKVYDIVSSFRGKRIKYIDDNGDIRSTDKKWSFGRLDKKYMEDYDWDNRGRVQTETRQGESS